MDHDVISCFSGRSEYFFVQILHLPYQCLHWTMSKEKKNGIWLRPMTKTPIPIENSTTNWQHKSATKNLKQKQ